MKDLHVLPKVRDSWSYLYVEHCKIDQEAKAIALHDDEGTTPIPIATLTLLMLGPGTSISHSAIRSLAENGCMVLWTGEESVRLYAQGMGETRSSQNFLRQARLCMDPQQHLQVVLRMYKRRFGGEWDSNWTLQQIRGKEGVRVREAYATSARETGIEWKGRQFNRANWRESDPINRALSCANSCLYGVCHAAIVSAGYSPALGFVHTGKMLSFVYDVADLYKAEITTPVAFRAASEGGDKLEGRVRHACRDAFREQRLLQQIVPDLDLILQDTAPALEVAPDLDVDAEIAAPSDLWDPSRAVQGGVNHGDPDPEGEQPW
jgi:CRISP-associated protein Cas1